MKERNELFELCKQVYEVTGWANGGFLYEFSMNAASGSNVVFPAGRTPNAYPYDNTVYPLYTSDYLLEKLPFRTKYSRGDGRIAKGWCYLVLTYADNGQSVATYANRNKEWIEPFYSDTPPKALLKLTLNLHENKVL